MKKYIIAFCLLFLSIITYAQIEITGVVLDETGTSVPGVVVVAVNENSNTVTDVDGAFKINVAGKESVLQFILIGYKQEQIKVGDNRKLNVLLKEDVMGLDEVVVIGYGATRKRDFTGSVSSIRSEALENSVLSSLDDALSGGVAGLMVQSGSGQPGSSSNILIRGANSLTGSTQPLIVVDGFPLFENSTSAGGGMDDKGGSSSAFSLINPDDIASIEVLKDASATAIYGNRGSNGVILVTTKKGTGSGSRIQYNSYYSSQNLPRKYDVMNFQEYVEFQALTNPNNGMFVNQKTGEMHNFDPNIRSVDWQDEVYRTGFIQNHSLSMQNSTDKTNFMVSSSFMQNQSIVRDTDWRKFTAKIGVDHSVSSKLKVGADIYYNRVSDKGIPTGGGDGTAIGSIIGTILARPFILDETTQAYFRRAGVDQGTIDSDLASYRDNPLNLVESVDMNKVMKNTTMNAYVEYKILNNLILKVTGGYNSYELNQKQFYPKSTPTGKFYNGLGIISNINNDSWINENTITWMPEFSGGHSLNILGGVTEQGWKSNYSRNEFSSFDNESLGYNNAQMAKNFNIYSNIGETRYMSFIGRANYSYKSKYLATATMRRDGTSAFVNNKWGNFYSGALAYNIMEEDFIKEIKDISNLKLRLSLGEVGNSNVPTTGAYSQLYTTNYSFNNSISIGQSAASLANENLKWEKTQEWNIGLELGLFNNRISLTADLYDKTTKDLLLEAPVLNISGFDKAWGNIGKLNNRGIELSLNTILIDKKDLGLTFNLNFSKNTSKIKELGQNGAPIYLGISYLSGSQGQQAIILREGGSIGEIYGYESVGVYGANDFYNDGTPKEGVAIAGVGEKAGWIKYKDISEDGSITSDDRTVIGNTLPDFFGAFSTGLRWKNFNLDLVFQYSYGNDVYNANYVQAARFGSTQYNQMSFFKDRWTPENPTSTQYSDMLFGTISSAFVEDASFLRFKTARLTYSVPSKALHKIGFVKNIKVYVAADNIYTFTKYSGYDPEITGSQKAENMSGALTSGFDYGVFPKSRIFTGGFNITF